MLATQLQLFCVSSLEKIFPDTDFTPSVRLKEDTMLLESAIPFKLRTVWKNRLPLQISRFP